MRWCPVVTALPPPEDEDADGFVRHWDDRIDAEVPNPRRELALEIANMMDEGSDDDGQWRGADICDTLAAILRREGVLTECPVCHSSHSVAQPSCPFAEANHPDEPDPDDDACPDDPDGVHHVGCGCDYASPDD